MNNVIEITNEHRDRHQLFKVRYNNIKFVELLEYALSNFYAVRSAGETRQPYEYNPIILFGVMSCFDPYMVEGMQACHISDTEDYAWKPWPQVNGVERTEIFVKDSLGPLRGKFKADINLDSKFIDFMEKQDAIARNYTYLKEDISDTSIILTIVDNYDDSFKRIIIKDVKKVCKLLAKSAYHFPKILISASDYKNTRAKKDKEVLDCIKDGLSIPVQDDNITLILKSIGITI